MFELFEINVRGSRLAHPAAACQAENPGKVAALVPQATSYGRSPDHEPKRNGFLSFSSSPHLLIIEIPTSADGVVLWCQSPFPAPWSQLGYLSNNLLLSIVSIISPSVDFDSSSLYSPKPVFSGGIVYSPVHTSPLLQSPPHPLHQRIEPNHNRHGIYQASLSSTPRPTRLHRRSYSARENHQQTLLPLLWRGTLRPPAPATLAQGPEAVHLLLVWLERPTRPCGRTYGDLPAASLPGCGLRGRLDRGLFPVQHLGSYRQGTREWYVISVSNPNN